MTKLRTILVAAALAGLAVPAEAAPITRVFTVQASGFVDQDPIFFGTPANPVPFDPVTLKLAITYDPANGDQFDQTAGISLASASFPVGSPLAFDYDSANDVLTLGGLANGVVGATEQTDDILLAIAGALTGTPSFDSLQYVSASTLGIFLASDGSVGAALPAPGALAVLAGLAGLAAARRRYAGHQSSST